MGPKMSYWLSWLAIPVVITGIFGTHAAGGGMAPMARGAFVLFGLGYLAVVAAAFGEARRLGHGRR